MKPGGGKFVCALFAALFAGAAALAAPKIDLSRLPKSAYSTDRFIEVAAVDDPGDEMGFRLPILRFASNVADALARAYDLKPPRRLSPAIVVHALDGRTNDVRVTVRRFRRRGEAATRIVLPSPGFSDLEELRFQIARAWFHSFTEGRDLPDWLVQGLLRAAFPETADEDARFVLELWRKGRLPFFPALCTDLRVTRGRGASLCGYVAGWMKERKIVKDAVLRLAQGEQWIPSRLAVDLTGETEASRQDRANDERLVRLSRSVFSPGQAGELDLNVFASRLELFPPFFDGRFGTDRANCTFREAIARAAEDPVLRAAAFAKARRLPFHAIGRGEEMKAASLAYMTFLAGLAAGEKPEKLEDLLDQAETKFALACETVRRAGEDASGRRKETE